MRKILKITVIILLTTIYLTGCTNNINVTYTINEDGTIHEKFLLEIIEVDAHEFNLYRVKDSLDNYMNELKMENMKWNFKTEDQTQFKLVEASRNFSGENIQDSFKLWSDTIRKRETLFTGVLIDKKQSYSEDIYDINLTIDYSKLKSIMKDNPSEYNMSEYDYNVIVDTVKNNQINISIITDRKVIANNADSLTNLDNGQIQYTWNIDHNKKNMITLSLADPNKENIQKYSDLEQKVKNSKRIIILLVFLVVILFTLLFKVIKKNKKR